MIRSIPFRGTQWYQDVPRMYQHVPATMLLDDSETPHFEWLKQIIEVQSSPQNQPGTCAGT